MAIGGQRVIGNTSIGYNAVTVTVAIITATNLCSQSIDVLGVPGHMQKTLTS